MDYAKAVETLKELQFWIKGAGTPEERVPPPQALADNAISVVLAEVERLQAENRGHLANNENLAGACKQYERRAVVAEAKIKAALALLESSDPPVYGLVVKALRGE